MPAGRISAASRNPHPLRPDQPIIAWVKYGPSVTTAEALTHDWVAKALDAEPVTHVRVPRVYDAWATSSTYITFGYIVVEHIIAPDCEESDVEFVAKAVEWLIRVPAPTLSRDLSVEDLLFTRFSAIGSLVSPYSPTKQSMSRRII